MQARGPVLVDRAILLTRTHAAECCSIPLWQIPVWDEVPQRRLAFLMNIRHLAASTIAAIWKDRWQIELLFKTLELHLRIDRFVGITPNAVQIQL